MDLNKTLYSPGILSENSGFYFQPIPFFIFLAIIFGILSNYYSRISALTLESNQIWSDEIVYNIESSNPKKVCSKIELIQIEMCKIYDEIFLIYIIIFMSFLLFVFYLISGELTKSQFFFAYLVLVFYLFLMSFIALKHHLDIYSITFVPNFKINKRELIEDKLFQIWLKYNCRKLKGKYFDEKGIPIRFYDKLKEIEESNEG